MKCLRTLDCSRAGIVPATQQTSPDPAFFSAPYHTHYREYIYYRITPHQSSQEAQNFGRSMPDPYPWGLGTRLGEVQQKLRCSRFVVRCSKDCGEVQQRLCKDCGEVVNNCLVNLRRAITMPSCKLCKKAGLKVKPQMN